LILCLFVRQLWWRLGAQQVDDIQVRKAGCKLFVLLFVLCLMAAVVAAGCKAVVTFSGHIAGSGTHGEWVDHDSWISQANKVARSTHQHAMTATRVFSID
jgi:hypothetical protein